MPTDPSFLCASCNLLLKNPHFDVTHAMHKLGDPADLGGVQIQYYLCPRCEAEWWCSRSAFRTKDVTWILR